VIEFRFAYIGDKLLVTIGGPDSKIQMANLIARVNGKLSGLTMSPRYIAQAKYFNGTPRSIEVISPRDFLRTIISFIDSTNAIAAKDTAKGIPIGMRRTGMKLDAKTKAMINFQKNYPSITTYIVNTQDANDGCERFIYRIPLEQLRYLESTISFGMKPVVPVKKPAAKPVKR
jgi:hypothetical protein